MVEPQIVGRMQCINTEEQCYFGDSSYTLLNQDPDKKKRFEKECQARRGYMTRCCPADLVNLPYTPNPKEIPIHVQLKAHGQYQSCPKSVQSKCYREDDQDKTLCVQNACNDAGYRLASNYYEICKSFQLDDKSVEIPDCSSDGCWGNRFNVDQSQLSIDELQDNRQTLLQKIEEINNQIKATKKVEKKLNLIGQKNIDPNKNKKIVAKQKINNKQDQRIIETFVNYHPQSSYIHYVLIIICLIILHTI